MVIFAEDGRSSELVRCSCDVPVVIAVAVHPESCRVCLCEPIGNRIQHHNCIRPYALEQIIVAGGRIRHNIIDVDDDREPAAGLDRQIGFVKCLPVTCMIAAAVISSCGLKM